MVDYEKIWSKTTNMATKQQPKEQPDGNQDPQKGKKWQPPRGIRYSFRKDRPNTPYYLHWRDKDTGKREALGYVDEKARELKAKELEAARAKHGNAMLSFDPEKWRRFLEFEKIVGDAINPVVVAHEWKKAQQGTRTTDAKTVHNAVTEYMRLRDAEKCWGPDTRRHVDKQLQRFAAAFGAKKLSEVDREEIRLWLSTLKDTKGKPLGPHAANDHRKNVNTFFNYALSERWGAIENPCAHIKPKKSEDGDPIVISLRNAWDFFRANCDQRAAFRVALEAFGGIRYTTAGLIEKDAINLEARGIRMKAKIHKTGKKDGRARYRQGHPDNLWTWMEHAPESTWVMTPHDYREEKRLAHIAAKLRPASNTSEKDAEQIKGLRNIWRHSFVSYHLAAFRNLPTTQYLAQHSNQQITEEYEGMADHTEALRYFMITPDAVKLSWEAFLNLPLKDDANPKK